ncbi:hypothetical protein [Paraglaciecola sp. 25GB23A]|uniref:hypothetical protein n=1 Tax=Paraglaciecola sp. 25GB23A TaxID=3156068 RepID=UPI0032AF624C
MGKSKTVFNYLYEGAVSLVKKHTVEIMLAAGIFCIIVGLLLRLITNVYLEFLGEVMFSSGSAILGAGVFAAIMKSWQFTNLFQKHILTVFTDPAELNEIADVSGRWSLLTKSRLKSVLPDFHVQATKKIQEQFFDEELQYHFTDYSHDYDIKVLDDNQISITNKFQAEIIKNLNCPKIEFKQSIRPLNKENKVELISVMINGKKFEITDEHFYMDVEDEGLYWLKIDVSNINGSKFNIVRVIRYSQNLADEPFVHGIISRYIQGGSVRARITEGYNLFFQQFGLGADTDDSIEHYDGYLSWTLAERGDLLLPGQGYMLVITKSII